MIKLIDILKEEDEQNLKKILVPRRINNRQEKFKQIDLQRIQEYIKNGCKGNLNLNESNITKLPDNLIRVGGILSLSRSNIRDLNNLEYVESTLDLEGCTQLSSLGKLKYIGSDLFLELTPLSIRYNEKQIREIVKVGKYVFI